VKEGIIKDAYELIIKEVQTIISISYIVAVGIGMLFNYQKFIQFGINIFDYADVFDFLISPFSDGKILSFTVISIILALLIVYIDILWKRKFPKAYSRFNFRWDQKSWFTGLRFLSTGILIILYLIIASRQYGKISKTEVLNQPLIKIRFSDNEIKRGKMIGKTNEVVFLLSGENVEVIPITSLVKEIQIMQ
jgi:hypothetical protein